MKIVLLTVHNATSPRKVDFHFWAEILSRHHQVDFVTVGFSLLTHLKPRSKAYQRPFNTWVSTPNDANNQNLRKYLWQAPIHPMKTGLDFTDLVFDKIFSQYPSLMPNELLSGISDMDICIIENGAGLLLAPKLKNIFPAAKFIYNVCDRIETLGYHPSILRAEKTALPFFDRIRVPAQIMLDDFVGYKDRALYIPHGLNKELFDQIQPSPYEDNKNVVSVGDMLFDENAVRTLATLFPDWKFHLFGRGANVSGGTSNIISYGEKPFSEIIPYIQHADIGLAPYAESKSADYLSQSSMKMIQYTYLMLPILAPKFAAAGRQHVCSYYGTDKKSLENAMIKAINYNRSSIDRSGVMTWEETADILLSGL